MIISDSHFSRISQEISGIRFAPGDFFHDFSPEDPNSEDLTNDEHTINSQPARCQAQCVNINAMLRVFR